jgi:hypothetical protein
MAGAPGQFIAAKTGADSGQGTQFVPYAYPRSGIELTKWPSGQPIPYWTDAPPAERDKIETAMCWWTSVTPVQFKRAEGSDLPPNVLHIYTAKPAKGLERELDHPFDPTDDCYSWRYSRVVRLWNLMVLARPDCQADVGTIAHELGHILGLDHEQKRPDSDRWIVVDWPAIEKDWKTDAKKQIYPDVAEEYKLRSTLLTAKYAYDLNSIMHYSPDQYGRHMRPVATAPTNVVGQRSCVSVGDQQAIVDIYK